MSSVHRFTVDVPVKPVVDRSNGHAFVFGRCVNCHVFLVNYRESLRACRCTCNARLHGVGRATCPIHGGR